MAPKRNPADSQYLRGRDALESAVRPRPAETHSRTSDASPRGRAQIEGGAFHDDDLSGERRLCNSEPFADEKRRRSDSAKAGIGRTVCSTEEIGE
jgi:hypothetical protein